MASSNSILDSISKRIFNTNDCQDDKSTFDLAPVFRDCFDFFIGQEKSSQRSLGELLDSSVVLMFEIFSNFGNFGVSINEV